jgi:hypothetical protein
MGTLREDLCTFMVLYRGILLRMRNVSDKRCRESQNTFYIQYLFSENPTVYEIKQEIMVEPDRPQVVIYSACTLRLDK